MTEQAFKESEFYRKWAIAGMPADKQRLALAAWQAAQSVPGFVLVPVESAKFCAYEALNKASGSIFANKSKRDEYRKHIDALLIPAGVTPHYE